MYIFNVLADLCNWLGPGRKFRAQISCEQSHLDQNVGYGIFVVCRHAGNTRTILLRNSIVLSRRHNAEVLIILGFVWATALRSVNIFLYLLSDPVMCSCTVYNNVLFIFTHAMYFRNKILFKLTYFQTCRHVFLSSLVEPVLSREI